MTAQGTMLYRNVGGQTTTLKKRLDPSVVLANGGRICFR